MVGVSARAIRIGVLDNDPFALDAMCAMISAVSKDFRVMWSTGSPAVAIEHSTTRIPGRRCWCWIWH